MEVVFIFDVVFHFEVVFMNILSSMIWKLHNDIMSFDKQKHTDRLNNYGKGSEIKLIIFAEFSANGGGGTPHP